MYELFCLHRFKCKYLFCDRIDTKLKLFNEHINSFKYDIDWLQIINSIKELKEQVKELIEDNQQIVTTFIKERNGDLSPDEQEYNNISFRKQYLYENDNNKMIEN